MTDNELVDGFGNACLAAGDADLPVHSSVRSDSKSVLECRRAVLSRPSGIKQDGRRVERKI